MKIIIVFFVSLIIAVLFPTFLSSIVVDKSVISTLFTIVGIIFSVGMSLIISVSTSGVKNKEARSVFRKQLSDIRFRFIAFFIILTILYIILPIDNNKEILNIAQICDVTIRISSHFFMVICLFAGIIYYIVNYYSIQNSVYELEDRIDQGK